MSAAKEKRAIPGSLLFLGGLATGTALGFGAEKLLEKTRRPRKPFKPPIPPYRETIPTIDETPNSRPDVDKRPGEAREPVPKI